MGFFMRLVPLKAEMLLKLEKMDVVDGEPIKGLATLESRDKFKVENIRLEIRVHDIYTELKKVDDDARSGRSHTEQSTVHSRVLSQDQNVTLAESFDVGSGDKRDFPFEVMIPRYSSSSIGGRIRYSLKAVAGVKGRPDVTKEVNPNILPLKGI